MNIDELKVGEIKQIVALFGSAQNPAKDEHFFEVGENYFIRTVTFIYTGKLVAVGGMEIVLEDCAWIADTGRFADALKDLKKLNEIEPFPDGRVLIGRGSIIDAHIVRGSSVPRSQK